MYYHLLTAWGFIQAGGYSGWDFWQYAPAGRPHVYPPLFHIVLALLMKAGIDKIILAKIFSVIVPLAFLSTLWNFLRTKFSSCLAFFSLVAISSSLSFYASLTNHMPSTIALTFGIIAIWKFMDKKIIPSLVMLTLCFYTHIGASYFIMFTIIIYALFDREYLRPALIIALGAIMLASPIIARQLCGMNLLSLPSVQENYACEFKTVDYVLAAIGLFILSRSKGTGRLFIALFLASFIYIPYRARLFSGEGYLPVALLVAVTFYGICESFGKNKYAKYGLIALALFMLTFSPTIAIGQLDVGKPADRVFLFDSAPMNMLLPESNKRMISGTIWFEDKYSLASRLIRENSSPDDIIYCTENLAGLCFAVISERATANYLLPEVGSKGGSDPFADSRIIIMLKYHDPADARAIIARYGLIFLGGNDILDVYKNPNARAKMKIRY